MKQVYCLAFITALILWSCQSTDPDEDAKLTTNNTELPFTEAVTITFDDPRDDFKAGDIVYKVKPEGCGGKIYIYGQNPEFRWWNAAMIFDSSNPSGEDLDLGTPNEAYGGPGVSRDGPQESNQEALNNILIITEDFRRRDPDDSYVEGSFYEIDFSRYGDGVVTMESFLLVDVDEAHLGEGTNVYLYGKDEELLFTKKIAQGMDNEVRLIDLENTEGVEKMVLLLNNSGAIDNITFSCSRENDFECRDIFASGENAICFLDEEGQEFNDWGWTNRIKDGYEGTLELWMGAEGCDPGNGLLAGYLHVTYKDCILTAKFEMVEGFYLSETQIYAGRDKYPKDDAGAYTTDRQNYPHINEVLYATEGTFVLEGLNDDLYLIVSGEVCWDTKQ